jgi:hypothetical protein
MGGQFADNDDHRHLAQRLSTAVWVQRGTARRLIPPLAGMAADRRQFRSGSVAVVAVALMQGRHAVHCPERRVDAGFGGLRATTQHVDRRWCGTR